MRKIRQAIAVLRGEDVRNDYNELNVAIYKDTNHIGEHGRMVVSHRKYKLVNVAVPFVFPGMTEPPKLDARLVVDLFSAFESQGYIPHHIEQYGTHSEVVGDGVTQPALDDDLSGGRMPTHRLLATHMTDAALGAEAAWRPGVLEVPAGDERVPTFNGRRAAADLDVPTFLRKGVNPEQPTGPASSPEVDALYNKFWNDLMNEDHRQQLRFLSADDVNSVTVEVYQTISNELNRGKSENDAVAAAAQVIARVVQNMAATKADHDPLAGVLRYRRQATVQEAATMQ
jgi:hypothetical protein